MTNLSSSIKNLSIIFSALFLGQVLFCAVAVFLSEQTANPTADKSVFNYLALSSIALYGLAWYMYTHLTSAAISQELSIEEKLAKYRVNSLIRWAMIEGGNILVCVCILLTANYSLLGIFAVGILFFLYTRPSEDVFKTDYRAN